MRSITESIVNCSSSDDNYSEDDFESSSDVSASNEETKSISPYEKYQERIKSGEICEVGFQGEMSPKGNFASKEMNTSEITLSDQIMQCCEGEDDTEFLSTLENIQNDIDNLNCNKQTHVINKTHLMKFIQRGSSLFEQLLVEKENMLRLRHKKELDIAFGCVESDQSIVNKLLSGATLMCVKCFNQPSTVLTVHSIDRISVDDPKFREVKSVLCVWQAHIPRNPVRVMLSQGTFSKGNVCILKNFAVACGTTEGIIQLWDIKESLRSCHNRQLIKEVKEYYLEDDPVHEEQHILVSLEAVSSVLAASLDNRGALELWNLKEVSLDTNSQQKTLELVRFKRIQRISNVITGLKNRSDICCPVTSLHSIPTGDGFLCPINNGMVTSLKLNDIQSLDDPTMYFPDRNMEGKETNRFLCESTVDQIVFSPFDEEIFFLKWSSGSIGLFHRKEAIAPIYFNSWNYLPEISDSKAELKRNDDRAISIQWCQRKPCTFYILTKSGFLLTFDLSKGRLPIKCNRIRFKEGSSIHQFNYISLIPSYSNKVLPLIVMSSSKGSIFSIKQFKSECISVDEDAELNILRSIFHKII